MICLRSHSYGTSVCGFSFIIILMVSIFCFVGYTQHRRWQPKSNHLHRIYGHIATWHKNFSFRVDGPMLSKCFSIVCACVCIYILCFQLANSVFYDHTLLYVSVTLYVSTRLPACLFVGLSRRVSKVFVWVLLYFFCGTKFIWNLKVIEWLWATNWHMFIWRNRREKSYYFSSRAECALCALCHKFFSV